MRRRRNDRKIRIIGIKTNFRIRVDSAMSAKCFQNSLGWCKEWRIKIDQHKTEYKENRQLKKKIKSTKIKERKL